MRKSCVGDGRGALKKVGEAGGQYHASDAHGVHKLRLAGPELAEDLGERAALDAAAEERVKSLAASRKALDLQTRQEELAPGLEAKGLPPPIRAQKGRIYLSLVIQCQRNARGMAAQGERHARGGGAAQTVRHRRGRRWGSPS